MNDPGGSLLLSDELEELLTSLEQSLVTVRASGEAPELIDELHHVLADICAALSTPIAMRLGQNRDAS